MFEYIIFYLLGLLVILAVVIFIIIKVILHFVRGKKPVAHTDKNWYLQISLSREDGLSQVYFLLALAFLGVTLLSLNNELNNPVSWVTMLLIMVIVGLASAYYFKLIYTLAVSLIAGIIWWLIKAAIWTQEKNIHFITSVTIFAILSLILVAIGYIHESNPKWKRSALVYKLLGIVGVIGLLFTFSTQWGLSWLDSLLNGEPFYASWQLSASLLILLVGLVAAVYRAAVLKSISSNLIGAILLLTVFFGMLPFFPYQPIWNHSNSYYYYSSGVGDLSSYGAVWVVVFNLLTLLVLLGLILSGYKNKETWQINFGAIVLFIFILVKYFDWFYTFLDKSVFFLGAGILLFAVGYFMEKSRRQMLQTLASSQ